MIIQKRLNIRCFGTNNPRRVVDHYRRLQNMPPPNIPLGIRAILSERQLRED